MGADRQKARPPTARRPLRFLTRLLGRQRYEPVARPGGFPRPPARTRPKVTAAIRVRNGEFWAEECLADLSQYVDEIAVFDDGSTDRTVDICRSFPKVARLLTWPKDFFHEGLDQNVMLALAKDTHPDWILRVDIDELFEERMKTEIHDLMGRDSVALYSFRPYHFWRSRTHYRVDGKFGSPKSLCPRLFRNQPGTYYPPKRFSGHIAGLHGERVVSDIRLKHYGYLLPQHREEKQALYRQADPAGDFAHLVSEQNIRLEEWVESP